MLGQCDTYSLENRLNRRVVSKVHDDDDDNDSDYDDDDDNNNKRRRSENVKTLVQYKYSTCIM